MNLALPALQAAATIGILNHQHGLHEDIANKRIGLIDDSVSNWVTSMDALIGASFFSDAFGTVPEAAVYQPVVAGDVQFATIQENLQNTPGADRAMVAANRLNEQNDIARMVVFDPAWYQNMHRASIQIKDLMEGKLPIDSVVDVLTDNAEQAALNGRIGNTCKMTARDLGISRLQMQALGRLEMGRNIDRVHAASPQQRQVAIQDMFQTPQNRIGLALSQAQLIQNSLQNAHNLAAAGDPAALAKVQYEATKIQMKLGQEGQRGNLINQFVPDFASVLTPQVNSIVEKLHGGLANAEQTPNQGTTGDTRNQFTGSSIEVDQNSGK